MSRGDTTPYCRKCKIRGWVMAGGCLVALASGLAACGTGATGASPQAQATTSAPGDMSSPTTTQGTNGPATVQVEDAGFSQREPGSGPGTPPYVGWGAVLRNASASQDALQGTVSVNLLDTTGMILTTDTMNTNVIPAGTTYYGAGFVQLHKGEKVAKIEVTADVGRSEAAKYRLPQVSHVRLVKNIYGTAEVAGQVKDDFPQTLSGDAPITVVLFDSTGHVTGGGLDFLHADLRPGRSAAFDVDCEPCPASKTAKAAVSMENAITTPYDGIGL